MANFNIPKELAQLEKKKSKQWQTVRTCYSSRRRERPHVPGVLLNAVYGGWAGGPVIHDNRLPSVGGIRGPILGRVVGVGVRSHCVGNVVVSSVDHGTALAGGPLETAHTWGAKHFPELGLQVYREGGAKEEWKNTPESCAKITFAGRACVTHWLTFKKSPEIQTWSCACTLGKI